MKDNNNQPMIEVDDLPNGCRLYMRHNEAGGRTYYSDEIGGGVFVWDTCLVDLSTLLTAMAYEEKMLRQEKNGEAPKRRLTSEELEERYGSLPW